MTDLDELFDRRPFSRPAGRKHPALLAELNALTRDHCHRCAPYARLVDALFDTHFDDLADAPFVPVSLFKNQRLASIDDADVFKTLTSSGTSASGLSRIYLDKYTARLQTKALANIVTDVLGPKRLPMILVDSRRALRQRAEFSARGAGLIGMATFGRDHFYALDQDMQLDHAGLDDFLERHEGERIFLFGFTFMIWHHFWRSLVQSGSGALIDDAVLIHGGGWKKLAEQSVSNAEFKRRLHDDLGIDHVHNYYGMVEQVGAVYLECEQGHFHASNFSEILIRDHRDWSLQPRGAPGIIQTLSILPRSYPGHSLMTEDLGTIHGIDDCACGRNGTYFSIEGRIPSVELRGCSDTYAEGLGGDR